MQDKIHNRFQVAKVLARRLSDAIEKYGSQSQAVQFHKSVIIANKIPQTVLLMAVREIALENAYLKDYRESKAFWSA